MQRRVFNPPNPAAVTRPYVHPPLAVLHKGQANIQNKINNDTQSAILKPMYSMTVNTTAPSLSLQSIQHENIIKSSVNVPPKIPLFVTSTNKALDVQTIPVHSQNHIQTLGSTTIQANVTLSKNIQPPGKIKLPAKGVSAVLCKNSESS